MARIRGTYPGGPSRSGGDQEPPRSARLERVEEIEARRNRASISWQKRRRARRIWAGFAVAVVVAGGVGVYVGYVTHRTSEQMTAERDAARTRQLDISKETNRVLMELWKMEDVEKQATPP